MAKLVQYALALAIVAIGLWFYNVHFFATILGLCFLIFFHELGHFAAAKLYGVGVLRFSIGFGSLLYEKSIKGTKYQIAALPLGGFVQIKGQGDEEGENFPGLSYKDLSPLKKLVILFAGPFANLLLAFLLYLGIGFFGFSALSPEVGGFSENSAAKGSLQEGDLIVKINGSSIYAWNDIKPALKTEAMDFVLLRNNEPLELKITPKLQMGLNDFGQERLIPMLGISSTTKIITVKVPMSGLFSYATKESMRASTLIIKGLAKLVTGEIHPSNLSGIITMGDITSKAAKIGLSTFCTILALISINLGLLNLLPLPPLDGGHMAATFYELLRGKEAPERLYNGLAYLGMSLLLCLMLYASFNDIARLLAQ